MRAITINVDEGNSLSGMLLPGCRVDVLGTIAAGKDSVSRTLVSNVLVQAVGQRLTSARPDGKEPPPFHTVTLIVMPREAQLIDLWNQDHAFAWRFARSRMDRRMMSWPIRRAWRI